MPYKVKCVAAAYPWEEELSLGDKISTCKWYSPRRQGWVAITAAKLKRYEVCVGKKHESELK